MTRQQRLERLIAAYWRTGLARPTLPFKAGEHQRLRAKFAAAEQDLAEYVAKNARRITIAGGK